MLNTSCGLRSRASGPTTGIASISKLTDTAVSSRFTGGYLTACCLPTGGCLTTSSCFTGGGCLTARCLPTGCCLTSCCSSISKLADTAVSSSLRRGSTLRSRRRLLRSRLLSRRRRRLLRSRLLSRRRRRLLRSRLLSRRRCGSTLCGRCGGLRRGSTLSGRCGSLSGLSGTPACLRRLASRCGSTLGVVCLKTLALCTGFYRVFNKI